MKCHRFNGIKTNRYYYAIVLTGTHCVIDCANNVVNTLYKCRGSLQLKFTNPECVYNTVHLIVLVLRLIT